VQHSILFITANRAEPSENTIGAGLSGTSPNVETNLDVLSRLGEWSRRLGPARDSRLLSRNPHPAKIRSVNGKGCSRQLFGDGSGAVTRGLIGA
jgi:hypothetical protein